MGHHHQMPWPWINTAIHNQQVPIENAPAP
jgi:hypothetical protein